MKKLLTLFVLGFCVQAQAQTGYVEPELVPPVEIVFANSNAEVPAGFHLANVDFLTSGPDEYASSAMTVDGNGSVFWRYTTPLNVTGNAGSMFNYKRLNDTTLTFYQFSTDGGFHIVLNNDRTVRDTVRAIGNVDRTRPHELSILPNGNYVTMGQVFEPVNSSLVGVQVKNGIVLTESSLIESILIQEITPSNALIREWRSLDYVDPVDTWDTTKITSSDVIKVLHTNSLDYFLDGGDLKILTSNRESNELMIIDWETGVIEQRIEGRNSTTHFIPETYSGDVLDLYGQHYAKILSWDSTNRILIIRVFNNRFNVEKAEGLVLRLELNTGILRKLKSFVASPDLKSTHLGNVDQYGNNWLVNWGRTYEGRENATGYNQYGIKQFDLFLPDSVDSYRILPVEQAAMDVLMAQRPVISQNGCMLGTDVPGYWSDGSFGMTMEVTDTGSYFVEIQHGIGWLRSESVHIASLANGCGSIGIAEHVQEVAIYPNPTTDLVRVTGIPSGTPYEVWSITGKQIAQETLHDQTIDFSILESGMYLIKIGETTHRVVKM